MKIKITALILLLCSLLLGNMGCYNSHVGRKTYAVELMPNTQQETMKQNTETHLVKFQIGSKSYDVMLLASEASNKFIKQLPLSVTMNDENKDGKYVYLKQVLENHTQVEDVANTGSIMLFGNENVVIFYEDVQTSYKYTKLGVIKGGHFKEQIGNENVEISFSFVSTTNET